MLVDVAAELGAPVLLHGEWDEETPLRQAESMRDAFLKAGEVVELVGYSKAYHHFGRGPASRTRSERTRKGFTSRLDEKAKQDAWNPHPRMVQEVPPRGPLTLATETAD